eukprot:758385-Hanusia_phi.AAC.1
MTVIEYSSERTFWRNEKLRRASPTVRVSEGPGLAAARRAVTRVSPRGPPARPRGTQLSITMFSNLPRRG